MRTRIMSRRLRNAFAALLFSGLLLARPSLAGGPPPIILVQPLGLSVPFLDTASFSVVALSGTTMTYQWQKNGTNIPGATSATYSILTVQNADAGNYDVVVQNGGGSVTSYTVTLTVEGPPTIVTGPSSQTVAVGNNVSFSTTAIGDGPLGYQWTLNGSRLSGCTNYVLNLTSVATNQAGSYAVIVSNHYGSVTSAVASLTVNVPPAIASQPQGQSVLAGGTATFSVSATGTSPLTYQWYFNGLPLVGASSATLTLHDVLPAVTGNYAVVVANSAGSVTSSAATLTATLPSVTLTTLGGGGAALSTNGFGFKFSVPSGITYVVLASTDLKNWTPICTNVASSASVAFNDAAAANFNHRYYKVMVQ